MQVKNICWKKNENSDLCNVKVCRIKQAVEKLSKSWKISYGAIIVKKFTLYVSKILVWNSKTARGEALREIVNISKFHKILQFYYRFIIFENSS